MASGSSKMEATTVNIRALLFPQSSNIKSISKQSKLLDEYSFPIPVQIFKGREKELKDLTTSFFEEGRKKIVIHGPGGYGKSELAKHFAKQCQNSGRIERVVWLNAGNKQDLEKAFQKLSESVDVPQLPGSSSVQYIYKHSEHFVKHKCLIIFDNVPNRQCIIDYEPPISNNYFLLMTTREQDLGDDVSSFELNPLTNISSLEVMEAILTYHYKNEDRGLYKQLVDIVDNNPLGLRIVASFVRQRIIAEGKKFSLKEYVEEMKTQRKESLYIAVRISLNKINEGYKNIHDLILIILFICSYLNPKFLYLNDLLKITDVSRYGLARSTNCEKKLKQALTVLHDYSFITYDSNKNDVNMHNMIQKTLRFHLKDCQSDIRIKGYRLCLEFLLRHKLLDLTNILKYADDKFETFNNFYEKLYEPNTLRWLKYKRFIEEDETNNRTTKLQSILNYINNIPLKWSKSLNKILFDYNYETKLDLFIKIVSNETVDWTAEYLIFVLGIDVCLQNDLMSPIRARPNFLLEDFTDILYRLNFYDIQNSTNEKKQTLLHKAVESFNEDLVTILLDKYQMDPNIQDLKGRTAIHKLFSKKIVSKYVSIVEHGIHLIAKDLINFGAILNIKDSNGLTPLDFAQNTNLDHLLFEVGRDDIDYLQKVLYRLGEQKVQFINNSKLIHKTIEQNKTEMFKLLLQYDIDINNKAYHCKDDVSLLHSAARNWNLEVIEILIQRNIDVDKTVINEVDTPLLFGFKYVSKYMLSKKNVEDIHKILDLLKCNEHKNITDKHGNTILHYAVYNSQKYLIKLLVEKYQMDINAKNKYGWTPIYCTLHGGCKCSRRNQEQGIEVVEELKRCGARLDITDNDGITPIQLARKTGREYLIPYLSEKKETLIL